MRKSMWLLTRQYFSCSQKLHQMTMSSQPRDWTKTCGKSKFYMKKVEKQQQTGPALSRCSCIGPRAMVFGRLFIFVRYSLRQIIQ